uniref:methylated diphthine methylhydrolase n=1 Tax=Timema tahoe TaxID=61484 RepID=A0A7R9IQ57_9NEOP|nr:unnamed protein product [Timema tahoe]
MPSIKTLHVWNTKYSADSVEWCPVVPHRRVFVCGTYQVDSGADTHSEAAISSTVDDQLATVEQDEDIQRDLTTDSDENPPELQSPMSYKRRGRLFMFALGCSAELCLLQQIEMPAILDLKWCHIEIHDKILLAVANAKGEVLIYELLCTKKSDISVDMDYKLSLLTALSIAEDSECETLALSFDWSTGRNSIFNISEENPLLTVSDSRGGITLLRLTGSTLERVDSWRAHNFEAWITAFDYWNTSIVYSGGDDCKFLAFDWRCSPNPVSTNRTHEAGVTSLHCNAVTEHIIVSGSYDENLRVWDTRSLKRPTDTVPLGGGVWRLKWDPHRCQHLLAACMHGGFRVVDCSARPDPPQVVAEFNGHQSLAYGSDFCHFSKEELKSILPEEDFEDESQCFDAVFIIGTCSFYDHTLRTGAATFSFKYLLICPHEAELTLFLAHCFTEDPEMLGLLGLNLGPQDL